MSEQSSMSQSAMKYRFGILRRLKESNKTPFGILLLSAVIGAFVGLVGTLFELGTTWVSNYRSSSVNELITDKWLLIPAMFAVSAILAMIGYYLVKKISPESGGSGIPEIEGALQDLRPVRWWRVIPVKFLVD